MSPLGNSFIAKHMKNSESIIHSTESSGSHSSSVIAPLEPSMVLRSSTKTWYRNGRPNSGRSSHFVPMMPNTVEKYIPATSIYRMMHSTVCKTLSKPVALMMKNTTPSSTGMKVSEKCFSPMRRIIYANSRLQAMGSEI